MGTRWLRPNTSPGYAWTAIPVLVFAAVWGLASSWPRDGMLWDFGSFLLSGHAANRGLDPYGTEVLSSYTSQHPVSLTVPNLNPPLSVLVFKPIAQLNPRRAFRVWWGVSLFLYLGCVVWLIRAGPGDKLLRSLWSVSLAGLWMTLALGQIYVPLVVLVVVAYRLFDRLEVIPAGLCVGMVAAWKPTFLLWPVFLFAAGQTAAAYTSVGVFAGAWFLPAALLGPDIYTKWVGALGRYDAMQVATNVSVTAWLSTFLPKTATGIIAVAAIVGVGTVLARRRPYCALASSDLALVLSVALSPISWAGYTLMLLPVFLRRLWPREILLSAAAFVFPANLLWQWSTAYPRDIVGLRLLYPAAVLLLVVGLLRYSPVRAERDTVPRP